MPLSAVEVGAGAFLRITGSIDIGGKGKKQLSLKKISEKFGSLEKSDYLCTRKTSKRGFSHCVNGARSSVG